MKLCIRIRKADTGGYEAFCPSLPGCRSHGSTRDQAVTLLEEAIEGYVAAISNFVPEDLCKDVVEV